MCVCTYIWVVYGYGLQVYVSYPYIIGGPSFGEVNTEAPDLSCITLSIL